MKKFAIRHIQHWALPAQHFLFLFYIEIPLFFEFVMYKKSSSDVPVMTSKDSYPTKETQGMLTSINNKQADKREKVVLKKKVTLLRGISIIIGTIIGAGIFISPKGILQNTGSIGMSLTVWTACGILSLFGEYQPGIFILHTCHFTDGRKVRIFVAFMP